MKERPIIFNGDMVRAILDGRKTQTRRPIKPQPPEWIDSLHGNEFRKRAPYLIDDVPVARGFCYGDNDGEYTKAPWNVGDLLWVRERARLIDCKNKAFVTGIRDDDWARFRYEADGKESGKVPYPERLSVLKFGKCCPNGCYREASRITLEVVRVWVERVQDISEEDAIAEGLAQVGRSSFGYPLYSADPQARAEDHHIKGNNTYDCPRHGFWDLWDSIYSNWCEDPWVWCASFKVVKS